MGFGTEAELKARLIEATLGRCCLLEPLPTDADAFARRCAEAKSRVSLVAQEFMRLTGQRWSSMRHCRSACPAEDLPPRWSPISRPSSVRLLPKDFLVAFGWDKLAHFARYPQGCRGQLGQTPQQSGARRPVDGGVEAARPGLGSASASPADAGGKTRRWKSSAGCWRSCASACTRRN